MSERRTAGILLHVSSLPSEYGVGTLGKSAYDFIDWLEETKMKIWQVLPLVPTNYGDSPYQSVSSTALNYYFIDFDILYQKGLLKKRDYQFIKFNYIDTKVEYSLLFENKISILRLAFENFDINSNSFISFLNEGRFNDFSLFMTIKELNSYKAWNLWEMQYQVYSKELEEKIIKEHNNNYLFWQWTQFEFLNQWNKLRDYANKKNIKIMGDTPLYVAYDSVEVWKHPEMFILNEDKSLKLVAGCPPDCFTDDGQLWGNPVYNWEYQKSNNYKFWNYKIEESFKLFDILRIDHFRGFDRFYAIPAEDVNARNGKWMDGPKIDLFKDKRNLKIVAEDLGFIDEGVVKLMNQTGYPGMKILEFAFDGNPNNEHKPSNTTENYCVYTGTHDNMPLFQYVKDLSSEGLNIMKKDLILQCKLLNVGIKGIRSEKSITNKIIELAFASKANMCILPIQDLLCMDGRSRMNLPSTVSTNNWSFRITKYKLSESLKSKIKGYIEKYNR